MSEKEDKAKEDKAKEDKAKEDKAKEEKSVTQEEKERLVLDGREEEEKRVSLF